MAHLLPTSYTRYSLTEEEQRTGQMLTLQNVQVIQNLICDIAEQKLSLVFTPNDVMSYVQQEAELQGQLGILKMVLELSQAVNPSLSL